MIKSMTGFGRAEYSDEKRNVIVEIRSVNHRYCDISVRMPRRYSFAEEKIKAAIKETVKRGKLDVSVIVDNVAESDVTVNLNQMVAKQYYENLKMLQDAFDVSGEITLEYLASLPDVLKAVPDVEDEEEVTEALLIPVRRAVEDFDRMRTVEGAKLAEDLIARGNTVAALVSQVEKLSPDAVSHYAGKLKERIEELLEGNAEVPEDRILVEAAVFAEKADVTEEMVRLRSHCVQLEKIITSSGKPEGKKLDFLVQEMNREANTTGSKANFIDITNIVIEMKSEIEKIREQVQNIE